MLLCSNSRDDETILKMFVMVFMKEEDGSSYLGI